jgi:hypothetical protein
MVITQSQSPHCHGSLRRYTGAPPQAIRKGLGWDGQPRDQETKRPSCLGNQRKIASEIVKYKYSITIAKFGI